MERYKVIKEIGSTSNATLYLSSCIQTDRKVAVKVINLETQFNLDTTAQLLKNELESHWTLAHCEGIQKLLEVIIGNSTMYMILEYQEHGSLRSMMK